MKTIGYLTIFIYFPDKFLRFGPGFFGSRYRPIRPMMQTLYAHAPYVNSSVLRPRNSSGRNSLGIGH